MKKQNRNTKRPVEKYFQPKVAVHDRRERKMPNMNSSSSGGGGGGGRRRSSRRLNRDNNRMAPAANPGSISKLL